MIFASTVIPLEQNPRVVHYVDWDIVLKCKNTNYPTYHDCLKSIWTEEYANPIEKYNVHTMIKIMGQVLEEILPIEQRGNLFDRLLRSERIDSQEELLHELYRELLLLQVRESHGIKSYRDLYIIDKNGTYYTIDQYDELKGNGNENR